MIPAKWLSQSYITKYYSHLQENLVLHALFIANLCGSIKPFKPLHFLCQLVCLSSNGGRLTVKKKLDANLRSNVKALALSVGESAFERIAYIAYIALKKMCSKFENSWLYQRLVDKSFTGHILYSKRDKRPRTLTLEFLHY